MRVWVDGRLVGPDEAQVSVFDHGLTVGDGVFETVKVTGGVPFAMTRHLTRLAESARALGLPEPDLDRVRAAADAVLGSAPRPAAGLRLRITYTEGRAPLGSDRGDATPTLVVAAAPLTSWPATATVLVVPWTRNERSATAGVKSTSYADNVVALAAARARGAAEALLGNTRGELCEGTGSNVVVAVDGRLLTPALTSGCLAGVTRALLLEWCDVAEADLPMEVLDTADEVALASTTRDLQGVDQLLRDDGGRERAIPAPGPSTREAAETFAARAAADTDP